MASGPLAAPPFRFAGRLRRSPLRRAASLDEVVALAAHETRPVVLILDVDGTLVRQGAPPDEFQRTVSDAIDRFEGSPGVGRVIPLTNGPERGVPRMFSHGNKPWTSRRRLGLSDPSQPVIVVGDQILTDGVLAWRLGAQLVHFTMAAGNEPPRQAALRAVGRLVERFLFRPVALEVAEDDGRRGGGSASRMPPPP